MDLPPRLQSSNVERFMHVIERIVKGPLPVTFDPAGSNLAPPTYAARLSDAMKSILDGHYIVDVDLFVQLKVMRKTIRIKVTQSGILVEPRITPKPSPIEVPTVDQFLIVAQVDEPTANAVALLLHHRLITQPCKLMGLSDSFLLTLQESYDININKSTDGFVVLT